jgi:tetratricopeptide (TPR) repeat protein
MRADLVDHRIDVVAARCTPLTTDTAFQPIIEVIGSRLDLENAEPEERLARVAKRMTELKIAQKDAVPLIASVLRIPVTAAQWQVPNLSPLRARRRTMEILIAALYALARRRPVLFIVEDLHWADPSSLELLRQLINSSQSAMLLALFTARPDFITDWTGAANVTEVELGALNPAESETLIRKVAKDKLLPPEVVWQILERAGGNPLYLEEITRSVMESEAVVEREYSWELNGMLSHVVPASMEASLMARIDRLGEARSLLQLAASLGREFSYELLAAVAEVSEQAIRNALDSMMRAGLVFQEGDAYAFKHALVRDAAYNSLLRANRQRYHGRIAKVLAAQFPDIAENRPELLAHHLSGAGFHTEAATHWKAAGESAAKRSAVNEAVAHLRRALADLEQLPEDAFHMNQQLSVLSALAPVLMAVYGWASPEVAETCRRAIELARRLKANDRIYSPLWGLWTNQFVGGRLDEAMETATDVLAMALATGDPMLEVTGRHATSYTRYYRGEFDAAIAEAEAGLCCYNYETERLLVQTFQLSSSICSMTAKASSLWMRGRQQEGIALMEEMVAVARSLQHPPTIAASLAFAMFFYLYDRDWRRLFEFSEETYHLSKAEGFAMWIANAGMHRGRARIGLGQDDVGAAEVLEWGALFRQTGSGIIEGSATSMLSEALHISGRSEEALVASAEGERRAHKSVVRVMQPEIYRTRGDILRDLDRLDQADKAYHQAWVCARAQGACSLEIRALTSLLDLRLSCGKPSDLPTELRRAVIASGCDPDRPDLIAARKLLTRVGC